MIWSYISSSCDLHLRLFRVGQCDGVAYLSYRNVHLPFANLIRIKRSVLGAYPFANLIRFRVAFWEHTRILHINPMVVCLSMYAAHSEIRTQIKKKLIPGIYIPGI